MDIAPREKRPFAPELPGDGRRKVQVVRVVRDSACERRSESLREAVQQGRQIADVTRSRSTCNRCTRRTPVMGATLADRHDGPPTRCLASR